MELASFILGSAIAFNVGIGNSASGMALAYGTNMIRRNGALLLTSIFAFLGAVLLGDNIIDTLSTGIFHESPAASPASLVIMPAVVLVILLLANLLVVPLSSTQIITAALVGLALLYDTLNISPTLEIVTWWIVAPFAAGIVTFGIIRFAGRQISVFVERQNKKLLQFLLVALGSYSAFAKGPNMAGKSASFLTVTGIIDPVASKFVAALMVSVAIFLLGRFLMDSVGKKIINLGISDALVLITVSTTIILTAAYSGIPVCQNQVILASITGAAYASGGGFRLRENKVLKKSYASWALAPLAVVFLTYSITKFFMA